MGASPRKFIELLRSLRRPYFLAGVVSLGVVVNAVRLGGGPFSEAVRGERLWFVLARWPPVAQ
eukprot:685529-Pyramimonas_sp.AAC.1